MSVKKVCLLFSRGSERRFTRIQLLKVFLVAVLFLSFISFFCFIFRVYQKGIFVFLRLFYGRFANSLAPMYFWSLFSLLSFIFFIFSTLIILHRCFLYIFSFSSIFSQSYSSSLFPLLLFIFFYFCTLIIVTASFPSSLFL